MKKFLLVLSFFLVSFSVSFAQMSDQQITDFIQQEMAAGTSQAQIVTKLMQKGVKIDQIRRLRQQYNKQIKSKGLSGQADAVITAVDSRMRSNGTGDKAQDITLGKEGSAQAGLQEEADIRYAEIQQNINMHVDSKAGPDSLKVFGRASRRGCRASPAGTAPPRGGFRRGRRP